MYCIVCGKGLCMEHIKQIEVPMKGGYPMPHLKLKKDIPKMMCRECIDATLIDAFDLSKIVCEIVQI